MSNPNELTELTQEQLRAVPDMELHSRLHRLIEETKRVQRELERRMIFAYEYYNMREHTANPNSKPEPTTDRQLEKQKREQAAIQAAIAQLASSIKAGGTTKQELLSKLKKGA